MEEIRVTWHVDSEHVALLQQIFRFWWLKFPVQNKNEMDFVFVKMFSSFFLTKTKHFKHRGFHLSFSKNNIGPVSNFHIYS